MTKIFGFITTLSLLDEQDTFFLFLNEALTRVGWEVYVFDADDLFEDGEMVKAKKVEHPLTYGTRLELAVKETVIPLKNFDVIFLKKDPPIDAVFNRLLSALMRLEVPTVNAPAGLLEMGTKAYLKHFSQYTVQTFYVREGEEALSAIRGLKDCVLKQSDSYGGKGVIHISWDEKSFYHYQGSKKVALSEQELRQKVQDYLSKSRDGVMLVVRFLSSAAKRGDKRVVILDGEILGSYIRLPAVETGICECANNGARLCLPTEQDRALVADLRPHLKKHGIVVAALDLLVDEEGVEKLSEINIINPGFCNLHVLHPELNIAKHVIDAVQAKRRV